MRARGVVGFGILVGGLALGAGAAGEADASEPGVDPVERGRMLYTMHCMVCHGPEARGDGEMAELLKVPPPDLTGLSLRQGGEFPFERVYRTIDGRRPVRGHGVRDMPIWGLAFQVPGSDANQEDEVRSRILQLVYYLRSVQRTEE